MEQLKLTLLSPERKLLESVLVSSVTLMTSEGEIELLPGHAPIVGSLNTGRYSFKGSNGNDSGFFSTGFFEVDESGQVTVVAEVAERKSDIDIERARRAQKKAEDELRDPTIPEDRFKKYQLKLQRALIRQNIANQ